MKKTAENIKGSLALLLAGFIFASYGLFTRFISKAFDVGFQTWTRGLISLIILLIIGIKTHTFKKIKSKDIKWYLVYTLGGAFVIVPFTLAVVHAPLGTALFLFYSVSTICNFFYGSLVFKERLTPIKLISITLAIIGMIFLYYGNMGFTDPLYLFWAIVSGFFYSLYSTFNKKLSNQYSVIQIASSNQFMVFIINLVISLILMEKTNYQFLSIPWVFNGLFALLFTATTILIVYGFKRIEVQKGSLILLSELIFVVLFGFIVYKEVPTTLSAIGSICIFTSLVAPTLQIKKKIYT